MTSNAFAFGLVVGVFCVVAPVALALFARWALAPAARRVRYQGPDDRDDPRAVDRFTHGRRR